MYYIDMKIITSNTSREAYLSLAKQLKTTINGRNIVIAPDRFAVNVTRAIISSLDVVTMSNVEIIPFSKLGEKFIPQEIKKCLSPNGAVMLLSKVLLNLSKKKELVHYSNVTGKEGFASELYAAITSLRNSGINPEDISRIIDKLPNNMKAKSSDIVKVYNEYLKELANNHEDSTTILEKLELFLDKNRGEISTINFYVTDIYEFTKKELDILHILANNACSLTVSVPSGYDNPNRYIYPNKTIEKLSGLVDGGKPEIIDSRENLPKYKDIISKYLFSFKFPRENVEAEKIKLRCARDKHDEVLRLALDILKGVREGRRYKDYEVYIGNLDEYSGEIKSIFSRYNIPFFIDQKSLLIEQAKTRYILSAIKCCKSGFARQDVLDFVKNPLFYEREEDISIDDIFEFENYLLKYNIEYSIFKEPFTLFDPDKKVRRKSEISILNPNDLIEEVGSKIYYVKENCVPNIVRQLLIDKLSPLTSLNEATIKMKDCVSACKQILVNAESAWYKHVEDLEKISAYYAKCSEQVDGKLKATFDEMESVLDIDTNMVDFYSMVKSMVEKQEIALVPPYLDSVFIGGLESRFLGEYDIYILGATNSNIPMIPGGGTILSRKDKETFFNKGALDIIPNDKDQLYSNMYKVCDIMKKPMNMLIISYPESVSSATTKPSTIITDLIHMFSNLKIEMVDFSNLMEDKDYVDVAKLLFATKDACYYEALKNKISGNTSNNEMPLYNSALTFVDNDNKGFENLFVEPVYVDLDEDKTFNDKTSVSKIETFYRCPYQYYLRYMLNLNVRSEAKFEGNENGTIIHDVLHNFLQDYMNGIEFNDESIKETAYKYFDIIVDTDFARLKQKPETRRILARVKEESARVCKNMLEIVKRSKFKPMLLEGEIGGERNDIDTLSIDSANKQIKLHGFIDRVDSLDNDFYIIDYKTYKTADLEMKDLYRGCKIQPLLYMRSVENSKNMKPIGVFYMPIYSSFSDEGGKTLELKGFASNDRDKLQAIDANFGVEGKSECVFDVKDPNKLNANRFIDGKHFDLLGDYAMNISSKAVENICSGYIRPVPLTNVCAKCNYFDVCKFKDINVRKNNMVPMEVIEDKEEVEDDSNK